MNDIYEIADSIKTSSVGIHIVSLWWATCEVHMSGCKDANCRLCQEFREFKAKKGDISKGG